MFGTEPTDSMTRSASSVVPSVSVTARTRAPSPRPRSPPSKATGAVPSLNRTPLALVPAQQFGGQLVAEGPAHRQRLRLDDGDVEAPGAGRRGDLAADEAATDDHDAAGLLQVGPQRRQVIERADGVPPGQRPWQVETARPDTRGDDQAVPAEHRAVAERHVPRREVRRDGRRAEPPVRYSSGGPRDPERERGRVELGADAVLRQRRPVVRHVRLRAGDGDLAGEAGLADRIGGAQARHPGSHHNDAHRPPLQTHSTVIACSGQTSAASSTSSRSDSSSSPEI